MATIKVKVYQHKEHKEVFLARNWQYCGGNANTPFYYATKKLTAAIVDANTPDFERWFESFLDNKGKTTLTAKMTESKYIEIDGFSGVVEKECVYPVREFKLVELSEVE